MAVASGGVHTNWLNQCRDSWYAFGRAGCESTSGAVCAEARLVGASAAQEVGHAPACSVWRVSHWKTVGVQRCDAT